MLFPGIAQKTAGNSCSAIELAVEPGLIEQISAETLRFVSDESVSTDWGVAIMRGFHISDDLRHFGLRTRYEEVSMRETHDIASQFGISLFGGNGMIGALAAVSLSGLPQSVLLDPQRAL